jgi:hypothetical protein
MICKKNSIPKINQSSQIKQMQPTSNSQENQGGPFSLDQYADYAAFLHAEDMHLTLITVIKPEECLEYADANYQQYSETSLSQILSSEIQTENFKINMEEALKLKQRTAHIAGLSKDPEIIVKFLESEDQQFNKSIKKFEDPIHTALYDNIIAARSNNSQTSGMFR